VPLQLGLAGLLALFFALAVLVGNPGRVGTRHSRLTALPVARLHTNLLANSTFEQGLGIWRPLGGASLAATSSTAKFGHKSLEVTAAGAAPARYGAYTASAGNYPRRTAYALSLWIKGDRTTYRKPAEAILLAIGKNRSSNVIGQAVFRIRPGWRRVTVEGQVRTHGVEFEAEIVAIGDIALGDRFFLDRVTLNRIR